MDGEERQFARREKILIAALLGKGCLKSLRCGLKQLPGQGKKAKSTDEQRKRIPRILITKGVLCLPFSILANQTIYLPEVMWIFMILLDSEHLCYYPDLVPFKVCKKSLVTSEGPKTQKPTKWRDSWLEYGLLREEFKILMDPLSVFLQWYARCDWYIGGYWLTEKREGWGGEF